MMAQATATISSGTEAFAKSAEPQKPTYGLWQLAWKRFLRHKAAVAGGIGFILIILFIIGGSFVYTEDYANKPDVINRLQPPTWEHPMGTDSTGRDILARIIYGGQISLAVGFLAVIVAVSLGVTIGALSGYYGGTVDSGLMRFTEAMLAIPSLLILIVLSKALLGKLPNLTFLDRSISGSVPIVILVIGFTSWMAGARIVRAQFLSLREQEFITAARAMGVKNGRIIWRHILPNTMAPIIVYATLGLVIAITLESYVSFLGLGVQEPTASWGNILNQALSFIQRGVWWLWFFPSLMIILTLLCVNFLGDGLRVALDPRNLVDS
jgi:peptide/nickel transport system permease protein